MRFWKQYLEYIHDNPEGYWFKRKLVGWGWTPARWQGWAVVAVFVAFLLLLARDLGDAPTENDLIMFFLELVGLVVLLIVICYRTGEPPKWQWGFPKKDDADGLASDSQKQ